MTNYHTTNSRKNGDKIGLLFIITLPTLVYIFTAKPGVLTIALILTALILVTTALIAWYRACSFVVNFTDTHIEQTFRHSKRKYCFPYHHLKEVHYIDVYNSPAINTFKIQKDGSILSLKVNPVGYGEKYVSFIKWLKTKNPDFQTFIYPKGSELHMRLRQELLKTEF